MVRLVDRVHIRWDKRGALGENRRTSQQLWESLSIANIVACVMIDICHMKKHHCIAYRGTKE